MINQGLKQENSYSIILRNALKKVHFDYNDLFDHHENAVEIEVLDEWLVNVEGDLRDYIDTCYEENPFELLNQIFADESINSVDLFTYCKVEMNKKK